MSIEARGRGFTLIELIVYIVVVAVALAGVLLVLDVTVKGSADPLTRKQMLAIAEALLEEVQTMPFTYCDPNDANAATAAAAAIGAGPLACAATLEELGPEAGEGRGDPATPFNNVNDYYVDGGLVLASPIVNIAGNSAAPAGYEARIEIVPESLNGINSGSDPEDMQVLRLAVTVSRGSDSLRLEGYRTRHAPNMTP